MTDAEELEVKAAYERCKEFLEHPGWVDCENASPEMVADLLTLSRCVHRLLGETGRMLEIGRRLIGGSAAELAAVQEEMGRQLKEWVDDIGREARGETRHPSEV
jgi:hypothetical protein